jgi:hypothetical protein
VNIYNFIESKDVSTHCRKIKKTWNTLEMVIIIVKSKCRLKAKRTALQELIDSCPDMPIPQPIAPDKWAEIKAELPQSPKTPPAPPPLKINDKVFDSTHKMIAEIINCDNISEIFENFYADIPTPFKRGDILMTGHKEPIIFVLDRLDTDNPEQLARSLSMGYNNYTSNGWGFFVSEAGILYGDHVIMTDTFRYYNGELSGSNRLLHYVGLFLNDKIGLPEVMATQCRIMLEMQLNNNLHIQNHGCYISDDLLIGSDKK